MATATSLPAFTPGQQGFESHSWPPYGACSAQQLLAQAQAYPHLFHASYTPIEGWPIVQTAQPQHPEVAAQPSELNSGVYKTDDFRMYSFKVRRCPKGPAHDWTDCPYCHPGEKAKRRDPQKYAYTGIACPDFRKATCKRGDACPYAHGVFECWLHPSRYRTQLCKDGPACTRSVCFFAHTLQELRPGLLQASLQQDWRPKALYPAPASPTAPPLLSSEEGSPRSLGVKGSPTEADLLQHLMPSPGSSYAGYSHLQHAPSAGSISSLYGLSPTDAQMLAPRLSQQSQQQAQAQQPQVHHQAQQPPPQQPQQHEQHLQPKLLPQPQAQLQDLSQAMHMLHLSNPSGHEAQTVASMQLPAVSQAAAFHLPAISQGLVHAPAHRRPSHNASNPVAVHPFTSMPPEYLLAPGQASPPQLPPQLPSQPPQALEDHWAWNPEAHPSAPAPIMQRTEAQWLELLNHPLA